MKMTKGFKYFALSILIVAIAWVLIIKTGSDELIKLTGNISIGLFFVIIILYLFFTFKKRK